MSNDNNNDETSNKKKIFTVSLLVVALGVVVSAMWPDTPPISASSTLEPIAVDIEALPIQSVKKQPLPAESDTSTSEILQAVNTVMTPQPEVITPAFMVQLSEEASTLLATLQIINRVKLTSRLESEKASVRGFKNKDPLESLGMGVGQLIKGSPVNSPVISIEPATPRYALLPNVQLRSLITSNGKTTAWLGIQGEVIRATVNMKWGPLTVNRITAQGVQLSEAGKTRWLRPYISTASTLPQERLDE